jgi:uncharacterized protein YndB with AHSA1/START domain
MAAMQGRPRDIVQTILIRAPHARIFAALTERDEIEAWWGAVSPDPLEGDDLWPGIGDELPRIRIVESRPDELLVQRWDHPLPGARFGTIPQEVRFELGTAGDASLVTVRHLGIPDYPAWDDVYAGLRRDWPQELRFLQAWVESGRRRKDMKNPDLFSIVSRSIVVDADQAWTWRALTDAGLMGQWLDAQVTLEPKLAGAIDIRWADESHIGGEIVLIDAPHHLIMHWWDAGTLAREDDPGLITVMTWTLCPFDNHRTRLDLLDTGYDLSRVDDAWMQAINEGWDQFLATMQSLARERTGAASRRAGG